MIRNAIADDSIVLSLNIKGMYNHVADLCEHWNSVVDICNGRDGPHSPVNAQERQSTLLKTLAWLSRWKQLHDERVAKKQLLEYIFLQMRLGSASSHSCWLMFWLFIFTV